MRPTETLRSHNRRRGLIEIRFDRNGYALNVRHRSKPDLLPANELPLFVLLLAQGGEFAFVLLGLGAARDAIPRETVPSWQGP